ncbi:MAG: prenyltransferase [Deltaproteobacteria bacterium]|nr:prenyltransferase [Deltaproteobacteria bacterium]
MKIKDIIGIIRAPFLILAPMCVLLGVATAYSQGIPLNYSHLFLVFLGGILAHVSVNSLNEYFDFINGLDFKTIKTPFSGGSGVLVSKPQLARYALIIGISSAIIVSIIGLYFIYIRGLTMLLIGMLGLVMVLFYPVLFVKSSLLSLLSPGLGFGISMVLGTHIALGGTIGNKEILVASVPFFLVNNLLLLNQFPDREPDESVGRRNVVIVFGRKKSALIYSSFNILAYLTIIIGVIIGELGYFALISLLTLGFALLSSVKAIKNYNNIKALLPAQGMNVMVNILTPLLLSIGLIFRY